MDPRSQQAIEIGSFARWGLTLWPPSSIRVVDWNIDRGLQLSGVIDFLASANADLLILQEVDLNARRTRRLNIAREIAQKLQMNYVFGCEFQELTQGTRSSPAYHGQATLSPWPLSSSRIIRFKRQSNFWRPRWFLPEIEPFQERIGGRMALVSEVNVAGTALVTYNLHLESRGDDDLRCSQLLECLADAGQYQPNVPIILAGDLNLDITRATASSDVNVAQFRNEFAGLNVRTTPPRSLFDRRSTLDWIFTRGSLRAKQPQVHNRVSASDHYPLSIALGFV
jgi:endonuclease/exonuclease/phosphatase family metal-dependent hydrolase